MFVIFCGLNTNAEEMKTYVKTPLVLTKRITWKLQQDFKARSWIQWSRENVEDGWSSKSPSQKEKNKYHMISLIYLIFIYIYTYIYE